MIDKSKKGWITGLELIDSLSDLGSYANKDDVYLFVRRYDRDSDGRIQYSDFCKAFTPKSVHYSSTLSERRAYYIH